MKFSKTVEKYLSKFAEPLKLSPPQDRIWRYILVIPAYGESKSFLNNLDKLPRPSGDLLVLVVLNKPDWVQNSDPNEELRSAMRSLPLSMGSAENFEIRVVKDGVDLFIIDQEKEYPLFESINVGKARKIGFDIALAWHSSGVIQSDWISSTDADAILPPDYFDRIESIEIETRAICWPYAHMPSGHKALDTACKLYAIHLHHYALGLSYAGSIYSHHSLGSCISVRAQAYAEVRGFPSRAAGEDFYMLNKLRKLGSIESLTGKCVSIATRESCRVPFGTGRATALLLQSKIATTDYLIYNPQCFAILKAILSKIHLIWDADLESFQNLLKKQGLPNDHCIAAEICLRKLGLEKIIDHSRKHSSSIVGFLNHFSIWFDAFRTLKFIHCLESKHKDLSKIPIKSYQDHTPPDWPIDLNKNSTLDEILHSHRMLVGWETMEKSHW